MKSFTAYLLGTFLLLSAASAADIWTSIGATGTILPVGTAAAQVSPPKVSYSTTSTLTGTFQIVYNVTSDSTAFPSWTTVEVVGSNDNTNTVSTSTSTRRRGRPEPSRP